MDEETLLEIEIRQDLERLNLDDDHVIADEDEVEINNNEVVPIIGEDAAPGSEDEGRVPAELLDYISTIQKQRLMIEEELEECDTLIDSTIARARGQGGDEQAVVENDQWKELAEEASLHGMTAEEYRKKLLEDIENEPFELEEMDFLTNDSEFRLPESQMDLVLRESSAAEAGQLLAQPPPWLEDLEPSQEELMIEKALKIAHAMEAQQRQEAEREKREQGSSGGPHSMLALSGPEGEGAGAGQLVPVDTSNNEDDTNADRNTFQVLMVAGADNADDDEGQENDGKTVENSLVPFTPDDDTTKPVTEEEPVNAVAMLHTNHLLEFEQYLREQFEVAEETFRQREQQLKQEMDHRREVEEKLMLTMEEQRLHAMQTLQQEEQLLAHRKQECQKKLDQEIEQKQKVLEKELQQHEKSIATLSAQLEEDRYQLEKVQRAEEERMAQRRDAAATTVQRRYKGHRVRKLHQSERQTLAEKKEQRKEEKTQQRIAEIEVEIQHRKEEEARKTEEARREKEEQERKIEEEKREKEEEKRLKKEEKEEKKKAEEEEKKRAKEEKKRKEEEEKRLKKEEQERKKQEEEKKKREEKERKKGEEEERKQKEEEERTRKEEEERERKEEEERKKKEEEERKRKEEEDRKRKEEEEERKKKEEERKKKEEERKKKEEERKKQEEENKPKEKTDTDSDERQRSEKAANKAEEERYGSDNSHTLPTDSPGSAKIVEVSKTDGQPQECTNGHSVSPVVVDLEPVNANLLPSCLEERRLAWMKACLPWSKVSNEPWKLKTATAEKAPRRPASAKKLPPLPESAVLEAAQVASLRQVTTVELKDLPGHSVSLLGTCTHLKHLTLTRCGLIALDGLSPCKQLQCINAQDNLIEYVDVRELGSLCSLNLAHNKLSSIHGLEGCTSLRWLDVSHNRLTKLGGLSPARRLHTLHASHNQLVCTRGVQACPTLQHVDLAANYLTTLKGLDRLPLLTTLLAASNNIAQMPSLENNVLLQELVLRENSIGPDLDLSVAWLPLLFNLDLSQNIIEEVTGSAAGLFVLKRLDLAVNQITDMSSFAPALSQCPRLEDLSLQGNAVLDEDNFRENVKNSLASLLCLNGETLRSQAAVQSTARPLRCFELLCMTQLQQHRDLRQALDKECRLLPEEGRADKHHICDTHFKFCEKSFKLAVEHRYTHEYGELSTPSNLPNPPQAPQTHRPPSARTPRVLGQAKIGLPGSPTNRGSGTTTQENDEGNGSPPAGGSISASPSSEKTKAWTAAAAATPERSGGGAMGDRVSSPSPALTQKEKFDLALKAEANSLTASATDPAELPKNVGDSRVHGQSAGEGWGKERPRASLQGAGDAGRQLAGDAGRQLVTETPEEKLQLSAKEKFERALAGLPTTPPPLLPPVAAPPSPSQHRDPGQSERQTEATARKQRGGGITADLVGGLMMSESAALARSALPSKFMDDGDDLDDLETMMEGLQFDIDGFLDLDQFDFDEDFLEKGWRPNETPQMPQNHPVLGRITSSSSSAAKPPLPPVITPHSPVPPPLSPNHQGHVTQAWRGGESPLSDIHMRVPPLRPPSSVGSGEDSHAVTTGRSRREDRLAEEWGFKDSRTAELMVQRANKMKHNAERRRKISKLDPQQRLRLFRKLEEVKGYFQAREEEAQQRDMERQLEYRTKAGRTFEWLHTQVGDHNVSSSRINPRAGRGGAGNPLVKTVSDSQLSHHESPYPQGYSPVSMDIESASSMAHHQTAPKHHRHSLPGDDLTLTGHSPMLPPIKTSSASSQQSRERERMSWRTEPAEKNVGWGGGKKRLVRK
ncbi:hypothetical protein ACOMHN_043441 [Nucella lapillus]